MKTVKKKNSGRTTATTGFSIEPAIREKAQARAKAQRRSFSAYIVTLIEADLNGSPKAAA